MRSLLLLSICFSALINLNAADNITVFSNTGYKFWVIVNGEKVNINSSERVVFSKEPGAYTLRFIIDTSNPDEINDSDGFPVEIIENFDYLFEIKIEAVLASNKKAISLNKRSTINPAFFNGLWNLQVNNSTIKNIKVFITDIDGFFADFIIVNDIGEELLGGKLDKLKNNIEIHKSSLVFYKHLVNILKINDDKPRYTCEWFYYDAIRTTLKFSQQKDYVSLSSDYHYFLYFQNLVNDCSKLNVREYYTPQSYPINLRLYK
jgi:hypothetical protein